MERIEYVRYKSFMFLNINKAMEFAFNLAKDYAIKSQVMPDNYDSDEDINSNDFNINKLEKSQTYKWSDEYYSGLYNYAIWVYDSLLEFDKDIINETEFC